MPVDNALVLQRIAAGKHMHSYRFKIMPGSTCELLHLLPLALI
jgi:hypothetical protein